MYIFSNTKCTFNKEEVAGWKKYGKEDKER